MQIHTIDKVDRVKKKDCHQCYIHVKSVIHLTTSPEKFKRFSISISINHMNIFVGLNVFPSSNKKRQRVFFSSTSQSFMGSFLCVLTLAPGIRNCVYCNCENYYELLLLDGIFYILFFDKLSIGTQDGFIISGFVHVYRQETHLRRNYLKINSKGISCSSRYNIFGFRCIEGNQQKFSVMGYEIRHFQRVLASTLMPSQFIRSEADDS